MIAPEPPGFKGQTLPKGNGLTKSLSENHIAARFAPLARRQERSYIFNGTRLDEPPDSSAPQAPWGFVRVGSYLNIRLSQRFCAGFSFGRRD